MTSEKLNKNQLRARMDVCLIAIGFFSAITIFSLIMTVISL